MALARFDSWVRSVVGPAAAGAQVYICSQPAVVSSVPPSPLVSLFTDNTGSTPLANPLIADGFGHAYGYVAAGTYTVVVVIGGRIQQTYPDQLVGGGAGASSTVLETNGTANSNQALLNIAGATPIEATNSAGTTTFSFTAALPQTVAATGGQALSSYDATTGLFTKASVTASAAGSTGQVQFNNGGALDADSNFVWDNVGKALVLGTTSQAGVIDLVSTPSGAVTLAAGGTNGLLTLTPSGTGVTLSVKGDANTSDIQNWYVNGVGSPIAIIDTIGQMVITPDPGLSPVTALTLFNDGFNTPIQAWQMQGAAGPGMVIQNYGGDARGVQLFMQNAAGVTFFVQPGEMELFGIADGRFLVIPGGQATFTDTAVTIDEINSVSSAVGLSIFGDAHSSNLLNLSAYGISTDPTVSVDNVGTLHLMSEVIGTRSVFITNVSEDAGSIVTLTVLSAPSFNAGDQVYLDGLIHATWLNGQTNSLISASSTQLVFNDSSSHGAYGPNTESGKAFYVRTSTALTVTGTELGGVHDIQRWYTLNSIGSTPPIAKIDSFGNMYLGSDLHLKGGFYDSAATLGTNGQVLTTTGTNTLWANAASSSSIGAFAGPGYQLPFPFYGGSLTGTTISTTANQVTVWKFTLPYSITINKVSVNCTTSTGTNSCNFGIYSSAGSKLLDSGVFTFSGAGLQTNTISPVTIASGTYYFAQSATTGNIQVTGALSPSTSVTDFMNTISTTMGQAANSTSGGVMPSTLGSITAAGVYLNVACPIFST